MLLTGTRLKIYISLLALHLETFSVAWTSGLNTASVGTAAGPSELPLGNKSPWGPAKPRPAAPWGGAGCPPMWGRGRELPKTLAECGCHGEGRVRGQALPQRQTGPEASPLPDLESGYRCRGVLGVGGQSPSRYRHPQARLTGEAGPGHCRGLALWQLGSHLSRVKRQVRGIWAFLFFLQ